MVYGTLQQIRRLGVLRPSDVDRIEAQETGITMERAAAVTSELNSSLNKRYRKKFSTTNPPLNLVKYVAVKTTYELLFDVRGVNPDSDQSEKAELKLARMESWLKLALSPEGDVELLEAEGDLGEPAVNAGGPLGYSEASPYAWTDVQIERIEAEGR